jgi:hypothetical protein
VNLWVARDVAPGPKIRPTLNTRNVPVVHLAAYRLDGITWLIRRSRLDGQTPEHPVRPRPSGPPVRAWDVSLVSPGRANPAQRDVYRSRQVNLPALPPGVYLLSAGGGAKEAWEIVNITQLAVVIKRAPHKLLAWACDHATGAPVSGASVALYAGSVKRLAAGVTRPDGTCLLATAPGDHQTVIVARDRDMAGVPTAIADPDGVLKMHFQTDRPIYRPGHTVAFKAILRRTAGQGYTPLANTACRVEVRDAKENVLQSETLTTNPLGTLAGQVELPAEGVPGPYTVVVGAGKEQAYGTFSVAEYRKPEFKVTVTTAKRRYLAGEPVTCAVQASYYFGAPLPQAEVAYQVRRLDAPYAESNEAERWYGSSDGNLYPRDTYSAQPFVAEGTVATDDAGRATIAFKTDRAAPDSVYSVQCTVRDTARRQVEASASVPVYAASLRLGLRTDLLVAPLGSVIPLQLRAADLDGKPAASSVTLTVRQPVWVAKEDRYRYREVARTRVTLPSSGRATAAVPAAAPGELEIRALARDATGRETLALLSVCVAGAGARPENESREPTLTLRLDRRGYQPGDRARIWVSANTHDRPILVAAEGADLWAYTVVPKGKGGFLWTLRTRREMAPNLYVDACQWARGDFLSANAELPLPDLARRLTVKIEPDRDRYRPGEPATYLVRTTDKAGQPVAAEVAFAVVDEAIFALRPDTTPDLFTFFWGRRENLTLTASSAPEELSGGAYQRSNALAPLRQQFLDTAHWDAHVQTGPDGIARISFPFPGNLTTWRATARAVTGDTRAGAATAQVLVSRPVMLRLAVPRQIVQGDRLTLVGTVHNRTDREREFETALTAEGLRLEGAPRVRVRVPSDGEAPVTWKLAADTLPESGAASLQGEVVAPDAAADQREELSDALRVGVRVVPRGIPHRIAVGSVLDRETTLTLNLPPDRLEPATSVTLTVRAGLGPARADSAGRVFSAGRNGSLGAADQLLAAASGTANARAARDALALLARFQQSTGGWGWWDEAPADPVITARVLTALAWVHGPAGAPAASTAIRVPAGLIQRGITGATQLYNATNLWEHRALLAAAITLAGGTDGPRLMAEVQRRGPGATAQRPADARGVSPYARLMLAEALFRSGQQDAGVSLARAVAATAAAGPETALLPSGEHPAWSASVAETTALALAVLAELSQEPVLQRKLAEGLARAEDDDWRSQDEDALIAHALADYLRRHPDPARPGVVEASCNGTRVAVPGPAGDQPLRIAIPRSLLKDGANTFTLRRDEGGEVFAAVEAECYRPARDENAAGLRVLRRLEARDANGLWGALRRPVQPAETLRCTVLVWPDDRAGGIRIREPIPAGCEFVDSEAGACAREEVRDGAVIHYLRGQGEPVSFRYYLRAESEGDLIALPAVAELLRRPAVRGNSSAEGILVRR